MKIKTTLSAASLSFFMLGCAQTAPAPVVGGYRQDNQVMGVSADNSQFSLTREVSARAIGQTSAPSSVPKDEELQGISPAAGPDNSRPASIQAEDLAPAAKGSLLGDWSGKTVEKQGVVTHTVQPGETVYRLARRYNTTPAEILKQNHMDSTADLASGTQLQIPSGSKAGGTQVALNGSASGAQMSTSGPAVSKVEPKVSTSGSQMSVLSQNTASADNLAPVKGPTVADAGTPGKTFSSESVQTARLLPPAKTNAEDKGVEMAADTQVASIEPAAGPAKKAAIAAQPAAAPSVKVISHTVKKGETVYHIAHEYNASVLDVMTANNFSQPQQLKSGMTVKVPVHEPAAPVATAGNTSTAPAAAKVIPHEEDETATATPVPAKTAVDEVKAQFNKGKIDPIAARSRGLAWPVHGQLIKKFGTEGNGVAQAGINIAVPPNTPVLATDNGTVLYAGSGLKTYGNLVLVRHESGMVSAYAHNNQLLVQKGESVKKGEVIALSGATGNVDKPQVHFELRRNAGAIDPMTLLAAQ